MAHLDVLIPAYNEASNLPILLKRIDAALRRASLSYQAILIDDHSTDETLGVATELSKKYPLRVFTKKGARGKAQSILEAASYGKSPYAVMIDADVQYPPEAIPEMYALKDRYGVVVARRLNYDGSILRRIGSRTLAFFFGKLLLGFSCDMQSGLKLFRRDILTFLNPADISPWALDLPLLHTATQLGYAIGEVEITFERRQSGDSKLSLLKPTFDIAAGAVKLKFRSIEPQVTSPSGERMIGAGVLHKGKQFVTHSTLHHKRSALHVITPVQRSFLFVLLGIVLLGVGIAPLATFQVIVAILSTIYFIDVIFNFFLILKSLKTPPEIHATPEECRTLDDRALPIYSILCPLYKEAHVIPQFLSAIEKIDWPKKKLDVMLLLEEDDTESVEAVKTMDLPSYVRVVVVPDSQPKTKPKACNYGLNLARGEYLVIYDAEDAPDPLQLKIAYLGFQKVGPQVKCLQAKLNYYNPHQNWLTRFFTAEYSLWFDVVLTGLQSIETTIPLGGTSNHFRTNDLLDLEGWDPFNVTEDCDLGVRLFKNGFKTAIIDSTTLEEANSNPKNWIRQRSRWIKGYMQTYLLHMRHPVEFVREQGVHAVLFQLTVGGKLAFILINPILWLLTISYFLLYQYVGPTIEALYPSVVFYMAVTSLIFGNFMFIYYYMIGCAKREHWGLMKWIYLIPIYWLMVSVAGAMALYQLIVKPHYWEKTIHGLHLKKTIAKETRKTTRFFAISMIANAHALIREQLQVRLPVGTVISQLPASMHIFPKTSLVQIIRSLLFGRYRSETLLVLATIGANGLNMVTSALLGKTLSYADFAVYSSLMSLLYLVYIPTGAFGASVNHKTAMIAGKHKIRSIYTLWRHYAVRAAFLGVLLMGIWLVAIPLTSAFLPAISPFQLLLFTPVLFFVLVNAISEGYLRGLLSFQYVALSTFVEPLMRLVFVFSLLQLHSGPLVASVAPLTTGIGMAILVGIILRTQRSNRALIALKEFRFPWKFFRNVLLSGMSAVAFFSLDTVLATHFLTPTDAGKYGLLGVLGKMMFFAGSLTAGFILPFVSKKEGEGLDSKATFERLFFLTAILTISSHLFIGVFIPLIAPYLGSEKLIDIRGLLPLYGLGILLYTLAQTIVSYYLAKKEAIVSWISIALATVQIIMLWLFHGSLLEFVSVMLGIGVLNFVVFGTFHLYYKQLILPLRNIGDFFGLFARLPGQRTTRAVPDASRMRILIFNWRDTRHTWAGGAEVYLHEIAKRLTERGHAVTIFAGNDGNSSQNDEIDGVRIIRRGGQYTVYIWAALYYVFRLRYDTDLVIDSENGIPFLTPIYVRKPIFLLIHHIHQDVFRAHLRFPLSEFAAFVEGDLMPLLYRDHHILTVSESSKRDIIDLGLGSSESIAIVSPGIDRRLFKTKKKTDDPSLVYVGRLKPYKNVDVALKAFALVLEKYPTATFTIAGGGESLEDLQDLTRELGIDKSVSFVINVTDEEKRDILARSWVAVQPSSVEGFGITVIEANAAGTPVVASNVRGLRDSVRHEETGLLVKKKSIADFAGAIDRLFSKDSLRESYSKQALVWSSHFDWSTTTSTLWRCIEEKKTTPSQVPKPVYAQK